MVQTRLRQAGFALPTVLIASVVMLSILAVSVSSVVAVRTSLKVQYYEQLAKEAGEAGVAYAQACLVKNGNVPLWSNANPLTPGTDCAGTPSPELDCPDDEGCSVILTGQFRTSFSVGSPVLDAEGRALTIPNTGYIELLRESNGEVWRRYSQPATQAAVVPDLCSGAATSGLGWQNAVVTSQQTALPNAAAARTISVADSNVNLGRQFYRKDISVSEPGGYTATVFAPGTTTEAKIYIDGAIVATSRGEIASGMRNLGAGCHVVEVLLTNKNTQGSRTQFSAAVQRDASAQPIAATDSSWRVSVGASRHFSSPQFYQDTSAWTAAVQHTDQADLTSFDASAKVVGTEDCIASCPAASTTYFRSSSNFTLGSETEVRLGAFCDDSCQIYLNGVQYASNVLYATFYDQNITLPAGTYQVGVRLYNGGTAANTSRMGLSIKNASTSSVYMRTTSSWRALKNTWFSGAASDSNDPWSYEAGYVPSPMLMPAP